MTPGIRSSRSFSGFLSIAVGDRVLRISQFGYRTLLASLVAVGFSTAAARAGTLTVNSGADSGGSCPGTTCTLRQAIATATNGDTISFAASIATIDLTSDELLIDKSLTINGPGASQLTVQRSATPNTVQFHIFHIAPDAVATISGLAIRNGNTPADTNGGAIFNAGSLTINDCVITENVSSGGKLGGGAIFNNGGSPGAMLTITNSTLSGNTTSGGLGGGGISGSGTVTITKSTISGNSAGDTDGGGIYMLGVMTINNSTISGNSAGSGLGGGIYTTGTLTLTNSTISGNSAGEGGGVYGRPTGNFFRPRNTIIAGNTAALSPDIKGAVSSQGYNLIGNTSGATINFNTTGNQLNVDPLLGPLQDNGGPTRTHALLPNSPAIDKGHSSSSLTDQRGFTRPVGTAMVQDGDGSDIGAFEVQVPGAPGTLANISTRLRVEPGDNALIGGFIVSGTQPKRVIVRAIGPSLPVAGALVNPILELRDSSGDLIRSNDNWRAGGQEAEIIATGIAPSNDSESAVVETLPANNSAYTALVRGESDGTGVGLVEAYDLDQTVDSKLANISTRGLVQTDDDVMIAGTIVAGSGLQRVLVRAIGPSLPVNGALNDPTLELRDGNGTLIRANNDWRTGGQETEIIATGIAPTNDAESALIETLSGNNAAYTAIVRGANNTTGVALVEIYGLD